ncbi:transporter [Virgibacillus dokdonensis]|uniref:Transporter n=1 Tax=Virgibacillus dokdonensis TaxID=302167 RepID=A0A2K9IXQ4_9BACI|nr:MULTISPECIES: ABC transporter ATP-binding protein [Virgibacillus]AUJ24204.1 Spermidine/putrescine import ATP-binding protein PotA [Virgibacillus dokdonensis]NWO12430.1 ABC transporter ATP-binding protein [Virgibacillus sp.]RFA33973.1 transporter [Virgibacillus dokdonensis]
MSTVVKNLKKSFDGFQALHHINLSIKDGEFLAILGPSGCGKTTLLRLLAGFDSPTDGTISLAGTEVANAKKVVAPEKRNVSMVFQSFALWPHMNVKEHIAFPLDHHRFADQAVTSAKEKRILEVLETVNLKEFADRMPGELSGGQKQRVSLARAIAPKPKLLLMDEPLSNLDAELRMDMRREIQRLHALTKASIVYVTHDQGEALAMADRIVVMNKGKIEQIGTPEEIYYHPETPFVAKFVGKANIFTGEWKKDVFQLQQGKVTWKDWGIAEALKREQMYILRPEQLKLSPKIANELTGTIKTKQFQGKEYHYSIEVNGQVIIAHAPILEQYHVGEEVALIPMISDES